MPQQKLSDQRPSRTSIEDTFDGTLLKLEERRILGIGAAFSHLEENPSTGRLWLGDAVVYVIEDDRPILYFLPAGTHSFFDDIKKTLSQDFHPLLGYFKVDRETTDSIKTGTHNRVDLSPLKNPENEIKVKELYQSIHSRENETSATPGLIDRISLEAPKMRELSRYILSFTPEFIQKNIKKGEGIGTFAMLEYNAACFPQISIDHDRTDYRVPASFTLNLCLPISEFERSTAYALGTLAPDLRTKDSINAVFSAGYPEDTLKILASMPVEEAEKAARSLITIGQDYLDRVRVPNLIDEEVTVKRKRIDESMLKTISDNPEQALSVLRYVRKSVALNYAIPMIEAGKRFMERKT